MTELGWQLRQNNVNISLGRVMDGGDRYLVRFERKGWDDWSRYVTIPKNVVFDLQPILEKTPSE